MKDSKLPHELQESLDELKGIRDEIKLKLHLATTEAKATWGELEPRLIGIEKRIESEGREALGAVSELVGDLKEAFRNFRDRLRG